MSDEAALLSPPTNFAVVHLPGRRFPGVVMQGDTLNAAVISLEAVRSEIHDDELIAELNMVLDQLFDARTYYEKVCLEKGIELPYPRTADRRSS